MSVAQGALWLGVVAVSLLATFALADRFSQIGQVPLTIEPRSLADRARQFEERIGAGRDARVRAFGLSASPDIQNWIAGQEDPAARARILAGNRPSPIWLWYRSSPRPLAPTDDAMAQPSPGNPPLSVSGMTVVALDLKGRLREYGAVPPQVESLSPAAAPGDWTVFFDAAGLDESAFRPVPPDWTPRNYADDRKAWEGTSPDLPGVALRIEAASHRGTPVSFQFVGPWARPVRMQTPPVDRATQIVSIIATAVIYPLCIIGGVLLARRNLQLGRGDRRGAWTLAVLVFALDLTRWALGAAHFAIVTIEQQRLLAAIAWALLRAAAFGLMYLAIEPHVRRIWPQLLITWSRLLTGAVRDSLLGRDLLIGAAAGLLMTLVTLAHYLLPDFFGWRPFRPAGYNWSAMLDTGDRLAIFAQSASDALTMAVMGGVGLVLLRRVVPTAWAAFAIATFVFAFPAAQGQIETGRLWLDVAFGAVLVGIVLGAVVRWGYVAGAAAFFVHFVTLRVPGTLDPDRLHFQVGLMTAVIAIGLAAAGLALARHQPKRAI